jgi:hypothetical protein
MPLKLRGFSADNRGMTEEQQARVARLIGFALYNLAKGKYDAVDTLLRKAYHEATGHAWDRA